MYIYHKSSFALIEVFQLLLTINRMKYNLSRYKTTSSNLELLHFAMWVLL